MPPASTSATALPNMLDPMMVPRTNSYTAPASTLPPHLRTPFSPSYASSTTTAARTYTLPTGVGGAAAAGPRRASADLGFGPSGDVSLATSLSALMGRMSSMGTGPGAQAQVCVCVCVCDR